MAYPWLMCLSHRLNPGSGLHSLLIGMHLCNPFQGCVVSEPSTGAPSALPAANVILPFPGKHPRIAPLQYFPAGKNPNLAGWLSVAISPECGLSPYRFPTGNHQPFSGKLTQYLLSICISIPAMPIPCRQCLKEIFMP